VVTKEVRELPPGECEDLKRRSLILTSQAWRVIRTDIQNNCALRQCAEIRGKLDDLFLAIDKGLQALP
jgi:hypothetical protein